jgi:ABC-2 type transport system permease protein
MNRAIIELTARQLIGKRRTLLLFAFAAIPILIAIIYRISTSDDNVYQAATGPVQSTGLVDDQLHWTANVLYKTLIVSSLLPLCALIFGTAALGSEIEDGTAVYILAKPIPRWKIIVSKLFVSWVATMVLVLPASAIAGAIALAGAGGDTYAIRGGIAVTVEGGGLGILTGFVIAMAAGSLLYCALFVMLSVITSRALIVGLIYVFFWEALITSLFGGTRILSVRQYTIGIAHWISSATDRTFDARLGGIEATILLALVAALATWYAIRRLQHWEIGESS